MTIMVLKCYPFAARQHLLRFLTCIVLIANHKIDDDLADKLAGCMAKYILARRPDMAAAPLLIVTTCCQTAPCRRPSATVATRLR